MTSGLETEWDYSGRKGRDGQKKKISKTIERKRKVKWGKDEEVNGQGGKRGVPQPHTGAQKPGQADIAPLSKPIWGSAPPLAVLMYNMPT